MPAQPVAENIGICSAHGFTGQQTAVGGTAPDGLVTLPRGDALCLQFFKIVTAQRHKIGQPRLAARDQLTAKVRQRVRCAVRLHRIKAAADGGGHRLAGGVGDLIQQHGLVAFPPQIVQRALGEGVEVEHRRAGKVAVFQHPRHGAELVVGQCPIGVGGHAVGGKRAVPDLDAALCQLAAERLRHGSIRQQGHCAGRVLRLGAARRCSGHRPCGPDWRRPPHGSRPAWRMRRKSDFPWADPSVTHKYIFIIVILGVDVYGHPLQNARERRKNNFFVCRPCRILSYPL